MELISRKIYKKLDKISIKYLNLIKNSVITKSPDSQNIKSIGMLRDYYKFVRKFMNVKGKKILDWGCGNGHISYLIKESSDCEVVSFSIQTSFEKINFFEKELKLNHILGDNNFKLPFPDNTFDYVISSGVLEHVNEYGGDIKVTIDEIKRVLKQKGEFVIWRLPFAFSIWEYFNHCVNKWYHFERFTPNQIKLIALNNNLELKSIELDGVFFFKIRTLLRSNKITNFFIDFVEYLCNFRFLNFLLNDIYCVLENK